MRNDDEIFYRVIYRDCNNEVHFQDYETKKELLLNTPEIVNELISVRKFHGEVSRDVTYLFKKFF